MLHGYVIMLEESLFVFGQRQEIVFPTRPPLNLFDRGSSLGDEPLGREADH